MATKLFPIPFARHGVLGVRPFYEYAGLSDNCRYAFYYKIDKITVLKLEISDLQPLLVITALISRLLKDSTMKKPIFDLAMSKKYLIIMMNQCLRIINIRSTQELAKIPHGEWEPTRLPIMRGRNI